jgi:hypothetical protein
MEQMQYKTVIQLKKGKANKLAEIRFRHAIEWALGVRGNFKQRKEGDGPFWWRSELQKRAGLKWDGEKFINV